MSNIATPHVPTAAFLSTRAMCRIRTAESLTDVPVLATVC